MRATEPIHLIIPNFLIPPQVKLLYVEVMFAWSDYPESYAGGSEGTGRISHAEEVTGDDPDEKGQPVLQVGG
jgi:hypothetical protein